jgi:hypothetical protein
MMNPRFWKLRLLTAGLALVLLVAAAGPALAQDGDFWKKMDKLDRVVAKWRKVKATTVAAGRETVLRERRLKKLEARMLKLGRELLATDAVTTPVHPRARSNRKTDRFR